MKKKKIFIVSFNQLGREFWKEHIDLEHAELWLWNSSQLAIDNLTTVWPDMVIVDGYFSSEDYLPFVKEINKNKLENNLYCLTPKSHSKENIIGLGRKLIFSRFNSDILEEINSHLKADVDFKIEKSA